LSTVELSSHIADREVDVLVHLRDGQTMAIEVKTRQHPLSARETMAGLAQLRRFVDKENVLGLLVSNQRLPEVPSAAVGERVGLVSWRDEQDDEQLAAVLETLLTTD